MKHISKFAVLILIVVMLTAFGACSQEDSVTQRSDSEDYVSPSGGYVSPIGGYVEPSYEYYPSGKVTMREKVTGDMELIDGSDGGVEAGEVDTTEGNGKRAGLITASAWDDNRYYSAYTDLFSGGQADKEDGKFFRYVADTWGMVTTSRVKVTVKNGDDPVIGATVSYYDSAQNEYAAVTDARGIAYIFPTDDSGNVTVKVGDTVQTAPFTAEERELTVDFAGTRQRDNLIKLMFVIDVTGSMGDELDYLTAEIADVINRVVTQNEGVRIDLAFLFYRDDGDDVKFSYADFMNVTEGEGLATQQTALAKQRADGGGDTPEAVDEALLLAVGKDWGEENSTKLIFHVLDAPPHDETINKTRYESAVKTAAKKGIRISPVLCSGADTLCEYLVRQEAIYTGGTFVFVTDHSGIGEAHLDPEIPNAVVEKLNDLLVRLICGYHSGTFADPVRWDASDAGSTEDARG